MHKVISYHTLYVTQFQNKLIALNYISALVFTGLQYITTYIFKVPSNTLCYFTLQFSMFLLKYVSQHTQQREL